MQEKSFLGQLRDVLLGPEPLAKAYTGPLAKHDLNEPPLSYFLCVYMTAIQSTAPGKYEHPHQRTGPS